MRPQRGPVALTKVHYYDAEQQGRNVQVSTIFREEPRPRVIRSNVFGHRWVLRVNEPHGDPKKSKARVVGYLVVFFCLVLAVIAGIVFSLESKFIKLFPPHPPPTEPSITSTTLVVQRGKLNLDNATTSSTQVPANPCLCSPSEVCLKTTETDRPRCVQIADGKDPTGCGGHCRVNAEYCKLLDGDFRLYQCRTLRQTINCSQGFFSCGNRCIPEKLRCDGAFHCTDKSDESGCACDLETHFQCGNATGCLQQWKKCDGKVDCWDNSDETNCHRYCANGFVACHDGTCIRKESFCDGVHQCPDKSDEPKGCELQK